MKPIISPSGISKPLNLYLTQNFLRNKYRRSKGRMIRSKSFRLSGNPKQLRHQSAHRLKNQQKKAHRLSMIQSKSLLQVLKPIWKRDRLRTEVILKKGRNKIKKAKTWLSIGNKRKTIYHQCDRTNHGRNRINKRDQNFPLNSSKAP